jgi:uncharacterized membrane protein
VTGGTPARAAFDRTRPLQLLVPAVAACALSLAVLVPEIYLRAAVAFPIALLLPGYALLLLAFGPNRRLDWLPALSLSALLSMAFYPLAGLLLAAVSIASSTRSAVSAVDVVVAVALVTCALRTRRQAPGLDNSWLPAEPPRDERTRGIGGRRMLVLVAMTLALAGLGLGAAWRVEPRAMEQPYTAFYLSGAWSHVSTPVAARGRAPLSVVLGVTNHTHRRQSYTIAPTIDRSIAGPTRLVTLLPGATWTGPVRGPKPGDRGLHELVVTLTMSPQGTPVGTLTLWIRTALPL